MVRAATEQAVRASISTPVRSTVSTFASTSTYVSSRRKLTNTDPTSSGWHSGSRFGVCFAAWIPATRATASTSPLVMAPEAIFAAVSASMWTRHRAMARRWVASLAVTSTIRARPSGSRCVNSEADMADSVEVARFAFCPLVGSAADLAHRAVGTDEVDLADAVPGPLGADGGGDGGGESVFDPVGRVTAAQDRPQ